MKPPTEHLYLLAGVAVLTTVLSAINGWQINTGCFHTIPYVDQHSSSIDTDRFSPHFPLGHEVVLWLVTVAVTLIFFWLAYINGYFIFTRNEYCKCTCTVLHAVINIVLAFAMVFVDIWNATAVQQDCHAGKWSVNFHGWLDEIHYDRRLVLGFMIAVPCLTLIATCSTLVLLWQQQSTKSQKTPQPQQAIPLELL